MRTYQGEKREMPEQLLQALRWLWPSSSLTSAYASAVLVPSAVPSAVPSSAVPASEAPTAVPSAVPSAIRMAVPSEGLTTSSSVESSLPTLQRSHTETPCNATMHACAVPTNQRKTKRVDSFKLALSHDVATHGK